jgi:hypothetical protein
MNAMTVKFPSVETVRIGADTLRAEAQVTQKWVKFTDLLRADGITSTMLDSKTGSQELREWVKDKIILPSFKDAELALMAKETKSLEDDKKAQKRFLQQQVGSRLGKIQRHLRAAENPAGAGEDGTKAGEDGTKTDAQRLQKLLDDILAKIGKMEKPAFDAVAVCDHLKKCKGIIPAV